VPNKKIVSYKKVKTLFRALIKMDSKKLLCIIAVVAIFVVVLMYKNNLDSPREKVVILVTPKELALSGNLDLIEPVPRYSSIPTAVLERDAFLDGFGMGPGLIDSNRYASNAPPL
jgi:hypothetical protein